MYVVCCGVQRAQAFLQQKHYLLLTYYDHENPSRLGCDLDYPHAGPGGSRCTHCWCCRNKSEYKNDLQAHLYAGLTQGKEQRKVAHALHTDDIKALCCEESIPYCHPNSAEPH